MSTYSPLDTLWSALCLNKQARKEYEKNSVHVCVSVSVCVYMYMCVHVSCVCVYLYMCKRMHVYFHVCAHICICICCVSLCVYMFVCVCKRKSNAMLFNTHPLHL